MNKNEFLSSLSLENPPAGLGAALAGLWWDGKGDWTKAHESAQKDEGAQGAWVHADLRRKEGDEPNACYWYGRAGKQRHQGTLQDEWKEIVSCLLG